MKALFIAGTDTGAGKTIVTGLLARYFAEQGCRVVTQKWIQTGAESFASSDCMTHLRMMGRSVAGMRGELAHITPYIFKIPVSAHLASRVENKSIDKTKIKESFRVLSQKFELVLVEGMGGVLVPFNSKELVIDIVRELRLPVMLVVANKLGAINHALLTIEALRQRKIIILGMVFNNQRNQDTIILKDNPRIIARLSRQKVLGILPYEKNRARLYPHFIPIGKGVLKAMERK